MEFCPKRNWFISEFQSSIDNLSFKHYSVNENDLEDLTQKIQKGLSLPLDENIKNIILSFFLSHTLENKKFQWLISRKQSKVASPARYVEGIVRLEVGKRLMSLS